jgi:F0F1-type ATP synthase gamma subunit
MDLPLLTVREVKKVTLVVITGDRGSVAVTTPYD